MSIDWRTDLETGVDLIDDQHRSIFVKVNGLLDSMREGKGKDEVAKVIDFLGDYVVTHFKVEEKYMEERHYPNLSAHRASHILFLNDFEKLKHQFQQEGPTSSVVLGVQRRVVDWLFDHIIRIDKAMAASLRDQARPSGIKPKYSE